MRTIRWAGAVALAVAASAEAARADECHRLVDVLGPTRFDKRSREVTFPAPVAAGAEWFLTVEGACAGVDVELNGKDVLDRHPGHEHDHRGRCGDRCERDDHGRGDHRGRGHDCGCDAFVRVKVALKASNKLKVKVPDRQEVTIRVQGIVPAAALPAGTGRPVGRATILERAFRGSPTGSAETVKVTVPTTDGLYTLRLAQGAPPALLATLDWNGDHVLGLLPLRPGQSSDEAPVAVRAGPGANRLEVRALGTHASRVVARLEGWLVDAAAPTVRWAAPAEGSTLSDPATPFRVEAADAITGVASLRVLLDGGTDVTARFTRSGGAATATLGGLGLSAGPHTLVAVARDAACNEARATLRVTVGGAAPDTTPPVLTTPGDLVVEQAGPAGSVVTYTVVATDDRDPAPVVQCTPASGSTFAAGTTTVTCTARDAAGNQATATFTVTVRDTTPPALAQPADLVVEQTSPAGAVLTFAAPAATDTADPAPVVECTPASGSTFAAGTTTVACTARDAAGNEATTTFVVFVQDTLGPTLSIEAPAEGALVTTPRAVVRLTFADGGAGASTVSATVDGQDVALTRSGTPSAGEATGETAPLAEGEHELVGTVVDGAGHVTTVTRRFEVAFADLVAATSLTLPSARSGGGASTTTLTVSNASPRVPLRVFSAMSGPFAVDPPLPPDGAAVAPLGTLVLTVRFAPAALGPATGALWLLSNDPAEPAHEVALSGQGTRGALELTLDPGPAGALAAGSVHRLRVRAVNGAGDTDAGFRGLVELRTTAGSPLDGYLLLLGDAEQGQAVTEPLPLFDAPGAYTIDASLLEGAVSFPLGSLAVTVTQASRGQVICVLDSGAYGPGQTLGARIFVDMGAPDGNPTTLVDVLGAYDLRLLFDDRRLEVASVGAGPSVLGGPLFVLPGSVRLMDLNDAGALTTPAGPDVAAEGLLEVARVTLRVRDDAPQGPIGLAVVADVLTTAEAATPSLALRPVGELGPRLGLVEGAAVVVSPAAPPTDLVLLGVLPRDGDGLVAGLQHVNEVRVLFSEPVDAATLGAVSLSQGGAAVSGQARPGDRPGEVVFAPDAPLGPGDYVLALGLGLASQGGAPLDAPTTSTFRLGPAPTPGPGDLDQDGEVAVLDLQARRDLVTGRTPGTAPDFPPVFLAGAPGTVSVPQGSQSEVELRVVDLDGAAVTLTTDAAFARLERASEETFTLTLTQPPAGPVELQAATHDGPTTTVPLNVKVRRRNTAPGLALVTPQGALEVQEGDSLEVVVEALDPDLLDAGDVLSFEVEGALPGSPSIVADAPAGDRQQARLLVEPGFTAAGTYPFIVHVRDAHAGTAALPLKLVVTDRNRFPEITQTPDQFPLFALEGETVTVTFTAGADPDGDAVSMVLAGETRRDLNELRRQGLITYDAPAGIVGSSLAVRITMIRTVNLIVVKGHVTDGKDRGELFAALFGKGVAVVPPPQTPYVSTDPDNPVPTEAAFEPIRSEVVRLFRAKRPVPNPADPEGPPVDEHYQRGKLRIDLRGLGDLTGPFNGPPNGVSVAFDPAANTSVVELKRVPFSFSLIDVTLEVLPPQDEASATKRLLLTAPGTSGQPTTVETEVTFVDVPLPEGVDPGPSPSFLTDPPALVVRNGWSAPRETGSVVDLDLTIKQPHLVSGVAIEGGTLDLRGLPPGTSPTTDVLVTVRVHVHPGRSVLKLWAVGHGGAVSTPVVLPLVPYEQSPWLGVDCRFARVVSTPAGDRLVCDPNGFFLRPGEDPRTTSAAGNPLVLYAVHTGSRDDVEDTAVLTAMIGGDGGSQFGETEVALGDPTLPMLLPDGTTDSMDYRVSAPIFVGFNTGPATLQPIEVLGDRIVYHVDAAMLRDRESREIVGMGMRIPAEEDVLGSGADEGPSTVDLRVPGLFVNGEPLDGANVDCDDGVEVVFPFTFTEPPDLYTLYLDDETGAPTTALETPLRDANQRTFLVHDLLDQVPELTPGTHRVRLYRTALGGTGEVFFSASFHLAIAARSLPFKTDVDHPPALECHGASPDDLSQRDVPQGDLALDDGDAPCTAKAGDSVLLATGEEVLERTDLVIPGRAGLDFMLRRTYRSQRDYNGPLGHGWDFDWNEGLFRSKDGTVTRKAGNSDIAYWKDDPATPGFFKSPGGHFGVLKQNQATGAYVLRLPNGTKHHYTKHGLLEAVEDRHGNSLELRYDAKRNIDFVLDVYRRKIDFDYTAFEDPAEPNETVYRLTTVRDYLGREIHYHYGPRGNLEEVVGLGGRTERYGYFRSVTDATKALDHNLLSVTAPAEGAAGPAVLQIVYGTNPADAAKFDRVIQEFVGGRNASGVLAGGVRTFEYVGTDPRFGGPKVVVTEPNGSVHEHSMDQKLREISVRILTQGRHPNEPTAYETLSFYDSDGLLVGRVHPGGNQDQFRYAKDPSTPRSNQRNVVEHRRVAGGVQLVTQFEYEPIFNQLATVVEPRGFDSTRTPANGGLPSPERYKTTYVFDYQEHSRPLLEASEYGLDPRFLVSLHPNRELRRSMNDQNGDPAEQVAGNVVRVIAPTVYRNGFQFQPQVTETRWNSRGLPTATIDALGHVTAMEYFAEDDPDGDGATVPDATEDLPAGYLKAKVVDSDLPSPRRSTGSPTPLRLRTEYTYDAAGNLKTLTNPRGVRTAFLVNATNEVTKITRGDANAAGAAALKLITERFYDNNGRVVRVETGGSEGAGTPSVTSQTFVYDILGNVVSSTVQVDAGTTLTTRYEYDASQNRTKTISPEGNVVEVRFDERNKPYQITRGAGTAQASTVSIDYDRNGNRSAVRDAEGQDETLTVHDGFNRLLTITDALGGTATLTYDAAGNVTKRVFEGHPAGQPTGAKVRLAEEQFSHDEANRVFLTKRALFPDPTANRFVKEEVEFDASSRPVRVTEDDGQVTTMSYDGANRLLETRDALGNRTVSTFDENSNVVEVESVEVQATGLVTTRSFKTRSKFDQLDRLTMTVGELGLTSTFWYDSRDNLILRTDPEGPPRAGADPLGSTNELGNTVAYEYDGLDRLKREVRAVRVGARGPGDAVPEPTGTQPGAIASVITLSYTYDDDSRLRRVRDDRGSVTAFEYDALGRKTKQILAEGTPRAVAYAFEYDRDDNLTKTTDANGSVLERKHDRLNRLTEVNVLTKGSGVVGSEHQRFEYDGLARLTKATDDNGVPAPQPPATCTWSYDSLGRVLTEDHDGSAVTSTYSGDGKRLTVAYGGRTLTYGHDAIDRITSIRDGTTTIVQSHWVGPGFREVKREYGNGTVLDLTSGHDDAQRIRRLRWLRGGAAFVDREYDYNRASRRTSERRHDDAGLADTYVHDSTYRIKSTRYDEAGGPGAAPRPVSSTAYEYDGVGNRTSATDTLRAGGTQARAYASDELNEYVSIGGAARTHDANGNLTNEGTRVYQYDAFNRLAGVLERESPTLLRPVARYTYQADGRRARKQVWNPATGALERDTRFVHDGAQEVVEQSAARVTEGTFVWAPGYVDSLAQFSRTPSHRHGAGTFYVHQDARFSVVAITGAGPPVERRRYDDFGRVEVRDVVMAVGLDYGFQGRRLDAETGFLHFRARFYDPVTGRFLSRDPVWDQNNVGNQYTFVGNDPATLLDPSGEIAPIVLLPFLVKALIGVAVAGIAAELTESPFVANFSLGHQVAQFVGGREVFTGRELSGGERAISGLSVALAPLSIARGVLGAGGKLAFGVTTAHRAASAAEAALGVNEMFGGGDEEEEEEEFDNCFLAGTNAETTSRGDVNIEDVRLGDRFAPPPGHSCDDPRCGEVVNLFRNWTDQVVTITAQTRPRAREHRAQATSGEAGEEDGEPPSAGEPSQTIRCTSGHPFFVLGRGYVFAGDLRAGDEFEARGERVVVASVEVKAERAQTFNFEVRCHHTYRVSGHAGQPAVLVHNTSMARLARAAAAMKGGTRTVENFTAIARTRRNINILNRWRGLAEEGIIAGRAGTRPSAYEFVGSQIGVRVGGKMRWIDTLVRHRKTGAFLNLESKTGDAVRSARQIARDGLLAQGKGRFVGVAAEQAGLLNTPTGSILTWTISRP